jgi:hypothetical protein
MRRNSGILISTILAAILIAALSFVMPKDKEKYLRDRFWTQKTFAPSVYDIVIMGDSRIYRGISPEIMEKILPGKKILNFGYSDGGLNPGMFEAAEKKLSAKSQGSLIVLGVTPNSITGYSRNNVQFRQEKTRPREDIFERLYLNGILYHFSATTPEAILKLLKKEKSASYYLNEYFSNGYVESAKFQVDTMESISSYISDFTNYKVEERYLNELISQVKTWNAKGIKVVGFRPPVSAPMRALEDTMGLFNEALIKVRFNEAGGLWIDFKPNAYKTYDGSHLDKESARKLSNDLAEEIRNYLER